MTKKFSLYFALLFMSACSNGICEKKFYLLEYCQEWLDGPLIVDERVILK